jgi:uncharacterized RDD family membrane protein YckC
MKCPKCGYLGFEDVDRCRNCGYDFSLTSAPALPDLTIRRDTRTLTTLDDLSLIDGASDADAPGGRMTDIGVDLDRVFGAPDVAAPPKLPAPAPSRPRSMAAASAAPAAAPDVEPTLFGPPIPDDEPLIKRPSPPRPPLAVRRATPEVPRLRSEQARTPSFDLVLDDAPPPPRISPAARVADGAWSSSSDEDAADAADSVDAGVAARFVAVVIDLLILAAIDAIVIYFTMQICGIALADLDILPKGPLVAFLFVQNGGYLVAFTAGGQTLGKMAAGIRVVPAESEAPLDLGRAFLRTLMWVLLAVPAGLGFISALVSRDHRGLHDRFAGTRVVRASA